jgi:hypothetical protein
MKLALKLMMEFAREAINMSQILSHISYEASKNIF